MHTWDKTQLTLEQHGFELHGSTYMCIFFPLSTVPPYTELHDPRLAEPTEANCGYRGRTVTLYANFQQGGGQGRGVALLTPTLFKGQQ